MVGLVPELATLIATRRTRSSHEAPVFMAQVLSATGGELSSRVRDILASRASGVTINTRRTMRGAILGSLAATVVLVGAVASAFMPRGANDSTNITTKPSSSAQVLPLAINAPGVIAKPGVTAKPALTTASIDPFVPRSATPETHREPLATATTKTQNTIAIARRVLSTRKNRLAIAALPKQDFARMMAPALLPIAALAESAEEASAVQAPKVIARVQPAFAPGQQKLQAFTLSFSLDAAGIPQQISLARGQASRKQLLAAQTALAQWRFEPEASAKFAGNRLEQSFSFQELGSDRCSVGTRICR